MGKPEEFAALLSQVAREVMRRRSSHACCGDLTLEQFETLRAVDQSRRPSMTSLSAALDIDLSTVSRNVSVLERNGYLRREKGAGDARMVHVRLTAGGTSALRTLCCGERDVLADVYQMLRPRERDAVIKGLELLQRCVVASASAAARDDERAVPCCPPSLSRRAS
jgi:DNA-binding MarR family transcriptional regulator